MKEFRPLFIRTLQDPRNKMMHNLQIWDYLRKLSTSCYYCIDCDHSDHIYQAQGYITIRNSIHSKRPVLTPNQG